MRSAALVAGALLLTGGLSAVCALPRPPAAAARLPGASCSQLCGVAQHEPESAACRLCQLRRTAPRPDLQLPHWRPDRTWRRLESGLRAASPPPPTSPAPPPPTSPAPPRTSPTPPPPTSPAPPPPTSPAPPLPTSPTPPPPTSPAPPRTSPTPPPPTSPSPPPPTSPAPPPPTSPAPPPPTSPAPPPPTSPAPPPRTSPAPPPRTSPAPPPPTSPAPPPPTSPAPPPPTSPAPPPPTSPAPPPPTTPAPAPPTSPPTSRPPAPTPDYDEMCAKLCAAGEGGSFCNCLRPPTSWAGRRRKAAALRRRCAALCALNPTTSLCDCSAPAARPRPAAAAVPDRAPEAPDRALAATAPGDGDAQGTTGAPGQDPDWDIICYDLCLLGDGGLLCHCDLLPFRPSGR